MEIWNRIPYTLERNGIPFVRECTVRRRAGHIPPHATPGEARGARRSGGVTPINPTVDPKAAVLRADEHISVIF